MPSRRKLPVQKFSNFIMVIRRSGPALAGHGFAVFLLAWLNLYLTRSAGGGGVFVWLPDAAACAALVSHSRLVWRKMALAMMLGIAAANLVHGNSWLFSLGMSVANAAEFTLGAWLIRRYVVIASNKIALITALHILVLYCVIAIPAGTLIGGAVIAVSRGLSWSMVYERWYLADVSGASLLLLPMLMLLHKRMSYALYSSKNVIFWATALLVPAAAWFSLEFTHFPFINVTVLMSFLAFVVGGLRIAVIGNLTLLVLGSLLQLDVIDLPLPIVPAGLNSIWNISSFVCLFATLVGIVADELREKNLLLTASDARFYDAMEFSTTGFALGELSGRILEVNSAFCRILGYSREELRGSFSTELTHPHDKEIALAYWRRLRSGEIEAYQIEKRYLHKQGHPVWAEVKVSMMKSTDGRRNVIVQIDDITQRHLQQQEILRLTERLSIATAAGGIGVWDLNLKTHELVWDEHMFRIYGVNPYAGSRTYEMWRKCVHPDDLGPTEALLNQAIYERTPFNAEFRIIDSEQNIRHIRAAATLTWDESRQPLRMVGVNVDITMLKNAEMMQEKARGELQAIIDQMPAMIGYWDTALRNRFGNQNYMEWFGKSPEEMRGKHMREVIGDKLYELNLPYIRETLRGGPQQFEFMVVDVAGSTRYALASYLPDIEGGEVKGFYGFVADITQLKQAQMAAAEAQAHLQGVIDGAGEFAIIATDITGTIRLFNKGAERMLGYTAEELVGKAKPDILHLPEEVIERQAALSQQAGHIVDVEEVFIGRARRGESETHEWTMVHKDGRQIPVRQVIAPVRIQGEITGFVGIANDISAQRQARQALRRAKELAEQASQAKSDFVANMSHEIRTPMNAILGMSHVLGNTQLSSEQRQHLDMIRVSAQSLLEILDEILDFSKIEAGKMVLAPIDFDLNEILQTILGMMDVSARQKGLRLTLHVAEDVPLLLHGDALRLRQILINLTGNAVKFTDQGQIDLTVEVVRREERRAVLRFGIRDTGIGIPPEQMPRLFHPFEQADTSITRRFGGTGLGLAISRRLVDMMGGSIDARSGQGKGSEFFFEVPFDVLDASAVLPETASLPLAEVASPLRPLRLDKARLLLVEDNPINQQVARKILGLAGATVEVAEDGLHAMNRLRGGERYDVILMDIQMPGMDGYNATRLIRSELNLETPIIAMTAGVTPSERAQCTAAGMNDLIAKPIDVQEMLRKIRAFLPGIQTDVQKSADTGESDFHAQAFLEMLDGDVEFCHSLIKQFIENTRLNLDIIHRALTHGRPEEAAHMLHALKGTAGTLRAHRLALAAEAAESLLRAGNTPSMDNVEEAYEKAKSAMAALLTGMGAMAAGEPEMG